MATVTRRKPGRKAPKPTPKGKAAAAARKGAAAKAAKPKRGPAPARSLPLDLEVDAEVMEFIEAIDRFKHDHGRPFPSWSEVLHILRQLGYRRA